MTGQDYIERSIVDLRESQSTAPSQQMMMYPDHAIWTADQLAEKTAELFGNAVIDIISGQREYVMPRRPWRFGGVCINDGSGNIFPLTPIAPEVADTRFFNWRGTNPGSPNYQGIPRYYVEQGTTSCVLLPTPNYNVQDGLRVWGYFNIGKWWDMSQECPLGDLYDEAMFRGISMRRCEEMLGVDPLYAEKLPVHTNAFNERFRDLKRMAYGKVASRRNAVPSLGTRFGGWGGWTVVGSI